MKIMKTFVILIVIGGFAMLASTGVEKNTSPAHASPARSSEASPASRMFEGLEVFFIAFAEFFMEALIGFWDHSSDEARCLFGGVLVSGFFLFFIGMASLRSWSRVWHRYME